MAKIPNTSKDIKKQKDKLAELFMNGEAKKISNIYIYISVNFVEYWYLRVMWVVWVLKVTAISMMPY